MTIRAKTKVLSFVEKKKLELRGKAKHIAMSKHAYRELLRSIRNIQAKTAKINVPLLYKLLRDQGYTPDDARAKLTDDCWFWSERWIREFLPDEAKHLEQRRANEDRDDILARRNGSGSGDYPSDDNPEDYPDDDDEDEQDDNDHTDPELKKQMKEADSNTLVLSPGEKAILSRKKLYLNVLQHPVYLFPKSDAITSMLRDHPEIAELMIEEVELVHNGTEIKDIVFKSPPSS
jgi:hypothetical protein